MGDVMYTNLASARSQETFKGRSALQSPTLDQVDCANSRLIQAVDLEASGRKFGNAKKLNKRKEYPAFHSKKLHA